MSSIPYQRIHGTSYLTASGAVSGPLYAPDGTVGAPSYSAVSSPTTGAYFPATNQYGIAADGVLMMRMKKDPTYTTFANVAVNMAPVTNVALAVRVDEANGVDGFVMYRANGTTRNFAVAFNGIVSVYNAINSVANGTAANPAYSVGASSVNTGIYAPVDGQFAISQAGTQRLLIGASGAGTYTGNFTVASGTLNATTSLVANSTNAAGLGLGISNDANGIYLARQNTTNWPKSVLVEDFTTGLLPAYIMQGQAITVQTTTPKTLAFVDIGGHYDTTGAGATLIVFNLPAGVKGYRYGFSVNSAGGLQIKANGSEVIQFPGSASSAGGTQTSTTLGASVIVMFNGTAWVSQGGVGGTWAAA